MIFLIILLLACLTVVALVVYKRNQDDWGTITWEEIE